MNEQDGLKRADWRRLLAIALMGTVALGVLAIVPTLSADNHPATIVNPGSDGPSRRVMSEDFPGYRLPEGLGHDGQQFYAVARQPLDPAAVAPDLDRPRYRLQRIAYPLLIWALHPTGGGPGLIAAFIIVGIAAVFCLHLATGLLSVRLRGSPYLAFWVTVAPGTFIALRFSMADNMALAAALAAIALSLAGRHRWAVAAAVLAVLTKESLWLLFLGLLVSYRDIARLRLAAIPALVAGAWWAFLHVAISDTSQGVTEFTFPFVGLWESYQWWAAGESVLAIVAVPIALIMGLWALVRAGLHHPLSGVVTLQLAFLPLLNMTVLGLDANGTRMTLPLLLVSVITWQTGDRRVSDRPVAQPIDLPLATG